MRRSIPHPASVLVPLAAIALSVAVPGCTDGPTRPPELGAAATAGDDGPSAVVRSLERAYAVRSLESFARLLAPEFLFRFQERDVARGSPRSWGREQEIASARGIFTSEEIESLDIRLQAEQPVRLVNARDGATHLVRISHTYLEVRLADGRVMRVDGDRQHLRVRPAEGGWVIVTWIDLPPAETAG